MKKTLVIGASENPLRVSYDAVRRLLRQGIEVVAIGKRPGEIFGVPIQTGLLSLTGIHTVTLYINPSHQPEYYDYLIGLGPERIIFNPGTENAELMQLARANGIGVEVGCTLVMLSLGEY